MTWTKSCQVGTTSGVDVAEVVPTWYNFYIWSRANLARLAQICNFFESNPILVKTEKKAPWWSKPLKRSGWIEIINFFLVFKKSKIIIIFSFEPSNPRSEPSTRFLKVWYQLLYIQIKIKFQYVNRVRKEEHKIFILVHFPKIGKSSCSIILIKLIN